MPQTIDWLAISPPLILAVAAVVVLLADAFLGGGLDGLDHRRRTAFMPAALTILAVIVASVPALAMWDQRRSTFCVEPPPDRTELFNFPRPGPPPEWCSFAVDDLTLAFWGIVLFGTGVVALLGTVMVRERRTPLGEWHFLMLCSATGALTIAAARDLITLVVALEVVSLPAFAMAGLRRGSRRASEAAVKFFLVSVISTAVMLMGISLIYGASGSIFLNGTTIAGGELRSVIVVGALLTTVGLAFKVAAVPFHMWVPDTYVGAPIAVAAYLSVVSKAAGFAGLLLVLGVGLAPYADVWAPAVAVMAALTMTVGNVLALRQRHAVRLLAWSSVAQAGYILVPFAAGADRPALAATIGYLAIYAFVNLGAFAVAALVGQRHPEQRLSDYRGLVRESPVAGWALAFALLALAGLPPAVVGLMAKVVVFDAAAGPATWLAVVMAVNVVIGLVYYALWLRELFLPARATDAPPHDVPAGVGLAIGLTFAAGVVFSVLPGWLLDPVLASLG
jgi:NADH-quinone oxidoreductase subunit N